MKVRFLKNHIQYTKDQEVEANEGMGTYWCRVGVCEEILEGDSYNEEDRRKELKPLKKKEINLIIVSHELDPENYKNHQQRIDAVIEAEKPVDPSDIEVKDPEDISSAENDFNSSEEE